MKKVSVIIPCYNAEKFISKCIESLAGQTLGIENMELIFVNDASTDGTMEVLTQWEKKYPDSVCVVDCAENGKQGRARNIGLSYATADYVGFMDNDDIIESSMFEKLLKTAGDYDCDLVVCYSKRQTWKQLDAEPMGRTQKADRFLEITNESDRTAFLQLDINRAIWNKLYRRSVIKENAIAFPEGMIYDDICFSELIKHYTNRIYILEEYLYHHIVREGAASLDNKSWQNKRGYFEAQKEMILQLRERGLYDFYSDYYTDKFFIEYLTFLYNFLNTYHSMPPALLKEINRQTVLLFPDYKEAGIVRRLLQTENGNEFYRCAAMGLEADIDEDYIRKLTSFLK
jgi:glycosyltransferase involved in cell wall biosynthesis